MTKKLIAHPAAECFPLLPEPRLAELADDIQKHGLMRSIVTFEGKILDGRNRYRACEIAGVAPTFSEWQGANPFRYVWSENGQRRDLDAAQRAAIAIQCEDKAAKWDHLHGRKDAAAWKKEEKRRDTNKKRSDAALKKPRSDDGTYEPVRITGSTADANHAKQRHADRHLSSPTHRRMEEVARHSPDLLAKVASGEVKGMQALRIVKRETLGSRVAELPKGRHRVIYADPPWKYGDERAGLEKSDTAAAAQYPTMSTSDICALDIRSLAADDAVLFCWATFPLLEDALRVVTAWGFDYKTAFVWDKQRSNIGNYHDARAELLLVCTRGSCPIEIDTRPKQVQSIARSRHSEKPDEFRELIDSLYPTGPRVVLFHRGAAPDGWKAWGNEATEAA